MKYSPWNCCVSIHACPTSLRLKRTAPYELDSRILMPVKSSPMRDCGRSHISVRGTVQGVGFRPFVYRLARELNLTGHVFNHPEGVEIEVQGPKNDINLLVARLKTDTPPLARVQYVKTEEIDALPDADDGTFRITHSSTGKTADTHISPDVAPCPECLAELTNKSNRRYLYPFINCTNCGPRYTIIESLPYDRPKTTMRGFAMCAQNNQTEQMVCTADHQIIRRIFMRQGSDRKTERMAYVTMK